MDKNFLVEFYSDFTQLKYVFAEVEPENIKLSNKDLNNDNKSISLSNTEKIKLNLLNEEIEILNASNLKLIENNELLSSGINQLNLKVSDLNTTINTQAEKIKQNDVDKEELEFLKLNLIYSSKCQKTIFKKGYKVGTQEYRECILRRGKLIND